MISRASRPLWAFAALLFLACSADGRRPNVVLVVLDTTRADHLSSYGYPRPTAPHLARLAEKAIQFDRAYSTSSWTLPSHASLFTGLLPATHQATQETQYLAGEYDTLAELLAGAGYETAAFSGNSWVGPQTNMAQGFEYVGEMWRLPAAVRAGRTNREIRRWLERRRLEKPFFLFVNYIDPHWRYEAPAAFRDRFVDPAVSGDLRKRANFKIVDWYLTPQTISPALLPLRVDLYDAELARTDAVVADLVSALDEPPFGGETLLIVTSDHGENLGENGHQGHSFSLYETTLRIPLWIRTPDGRGAGTRRSDPVQLADVFATVLAAAGVEASDPRIVGRDLLAGELPADRPIVSEYYYPRQFLSYFPEESHADERLTPYLRRIRSLRVGTDKLIWGSDGRHELYDLAADPAESRNLFEERPELAAHLIAQLEAFLAPRRADAPAEPVPEPDAETAESLRELGYIR